MAIRFIEQKSGRNGRHAQTLVAMGLGVEFLPMNLVTMCHNVKTVTTHYTVVERLVIGMNGDPVAQLIHGMQNRPEHGTVLTI